jgi:hypothetical protein
MSVAARLLLAVVLGFGMTCVAFLSTFAFHSGPPFGLEIVARVFAPFAELSMDLVGSRAFNDGRFLAVFIPLQVLYAYGLIALGRQWRRRPAYTAISVIGLVSAVFVQTYLSRRSQDEAYQARQAAFTRAEVTIKMTDLAPTGTGARASKPGPTEVWFVDGRGEVLATARSRSESGEIALNFPEHETGDCSNPSAERDDCWERRAKWNATWAGRVGTAVISFADCRLVDVPVKTRGWVKPEESPPHRAIELSLTIDSRDCR